MSLDFVGQRCVSEREPELGLGVVAELDRTRVTIEFPAARERRIYARGTPVLKRVRFGVGERVTARDGTTFVVEEISEEQGLLTYRGAGRAVREDAVSDLTNVGSPSERLLAGQADPTEVFDLRLATLRAQARLRSSDVRGYLGGRVDLIPHQFYILDQVSSRQLPRVLLADEVGLGKTIEACLILQRLLVTGRASRALVLVPESLAHQWFVELLRRFNRWFTLFDEERCAALETADPGKNPFLSAQLGIAALPFLAGSPARADQAVAAGWDIVIVDEAHHLAWTPDNAGPAYTLVERLAAKSPGLLLLSATPTQLGPEGHFARLRLLDPHRYSDLAAFLAQSERYARVAGVAEKLAEGKALTKKDHAALREIFDRDPARLETHEADLAAGRPGAREALVRTLLDQHGPGRAIFRNTRAALAGFPGRSYQPAVLPGATPTLLARVAREIHAEETGAAADIRYSYKDDPRVAWLADLLRDLAPAKVLLICRSERKLLALDAALKDLVNLKTGLFHEGLPLVQRDRQAAWFAEPDGARLLLCSEIGGEGRNFQFAHHLVLWDLPLHPGLVEQRIGRLDRIGQTETIRVHVPVLKGGVDALVADWYHRGLDAFEHPLQAGEAYHAAFSPRLLACAENPADAKAAAKALLADAQAFHADLAEKLRRGRDRLLELNSHDRAASARVVERVRAADQDPALRRLLERLLDHYGVQIRRHEEGDLGLDATQAYVEGFPAIPREGLLATFDRRRACAREDIAFLTADHPLVTDTIDLLVDSPAGTTAFCTLDAPRPGLWLEAVFVLEAVADARWQVDRFLPPAPVRVLLDIQGRDLTDDDEASALLDEVADAPLQRFLEQPGFNGAILKHLVEAAAERAETRAKLAKQTARESAATTLGAELQRLVDLAKVNDHVGPREIDLSRRQLLQVRTAIEQARLRLDSLRLIVVGPESKRR